MAVSTPIKQPGAKVPALVSIVIVAPESAHIRELALKLRDDGLACSVVPDREQALRRLQERPAHLVLLDIDSAGDSLSVSDFTPAVGHNRPALLAIIPPEALSSVAAEPAIADFVIRPFNTDEVAVRVKRLLRRKAGAGGEDVIVCGSLTIDKASCEVRLDGGLMGLTFKEYELLLFLISNRGRVFSRQVLLDRVWGHDYFGGDRTVDVHIRRLRSKIERSGHTFIETVRNVGYKFKRDI